MARTYVPGYGYVDSNDPGTRGTVKPGPKPVVTGQEPIVQNPIYITRPSAPYGAAEEDSLLIRTEPLFDFGVPEIETRDYGMGSADALESQRLLGDAQAEVSARLGQDTFTTDARAQQVADINDGYVVRQDDGTYRVVYGIYAQQAAARDRQAAASTPSNYQNLPVDQTAGAPSNYRGLPGSTVPPSGAESNDGGQYIGSTFSTDPTRFAPQYTVTGSVVDARLGRVQLLSQPQLIDYQQAGDPRGFLVYMGEIITAGSTGATASDNYEDARFVSNYLNLPDEQRQQVFELVNRYYPKYWEPSYVQGLWADAVQAASAQLLVQGKKVSPFGIFEETIAAAAAADAERNASRGGFSGGGGYGGGGGARQTIVLTSPTDAWVILNQAMQQYFGRKASENELSKFVKMLNAQERANPVVQSIDGTTSIQEGGFNPQLFAEQFVQSKEGAGEYAAATTFLDTFISLLEGDNGVL